MRAETTGGLRVLSLGAGVQSSTLLLMACVGEIEKPDVAIFADTQWEPKAVYRHLDWLTEQATAAGIPVERVSFGNLRDDALENRANAWIPLFSRNQSGYPMMLKRQCTNHYKLRPIRRRARALMQEGGYRTIEQWIGISLDEVTRMKPSGVQYITSRWPLIEHRMTRLDCLNWLERHGFPRPPKSACIGCPFHDDRYWHGLKTQSPQEWDDAVAFDREIRTRGFHDGVAYVHQSLQPLAEVDLSTPQERGQLDLFDLECEGMCGV